MEITDKTIYLLLKEIGVPTGLKGYKYIKKAIQLYAKNPDSKITAVYSDIALAFADKPSRVERAIRHAVTRTFDNIKCETAEKFFGNWDYRKSQPANKQFFASIVEYLKYNG